MSDDEKAEELISNSDEVDKSDVVSDVQDKVSTSTYNTALDDEEVDSAPRDDVTVKKEAPADDVTANGTEGVDDEVDKNHDNEGDDEGHLSDDQRSIGSSVGASSGSQVPDTEREDGDGQEEGDKKDKKLDHDEDRRDPQYIPKRGVFYEHDDRTLDDDPEDKKEPVREPRKSKPFEAVERWGHDMYNEDEQSPKTTDELVDMYGYDIRKEEGPPKARRRRRYGKGPNKYERSWEDEQAYNKTPTRGGFKGPKRPPRNFVQREEDFPALQSKIEDVPAGPPGGDAPPLPTPNESSRPNVKFNPKLPPKDEQLPSKEEIIAIFDQLDEEERLRSELSNAHSDRHLTKGPSERSDRPSRSESGRGRPPMSRRGRSGHEIPPFAGRRSEQSDRPSDKHGKGGSTADEDIATLAQHFSNAVINVDKNIAPIRSTSEPPAEERPSRETRREDGKHHGHHKHQDKHQLPPTDKHHQPPEQPSKSKRYSTQRQRPPQMNSGSPAGAPPAQAPPTAPGYLPPQQGYYPPQHGMCPPEGTPHLAAPPPAQFPPPPGGMQMVTFLPGVPPPPTTTFHPPPNVYVPPAPFIPPPPIVQPPPVEVYQGGVTYYNTQSQVLPRTAPLRRAKLAIPIVSPDNSQPIQ